MAQYTVNDGVGSYTVLGNNPLHQYSSYTYGITLYMLTPTIYNQLVANPAGFSTSTLGNFTLISTSSRHKDTRNQYFTDDFYFDTLTIETVVGMTQQTRGTNAISLKMSIIEPHGMSLLDRLMKVCQSDAKEPNYSELPYLIEIDFFGYDDKGIPADLSSMTKLFPIKFTQVKITASEAGSRYDMEAVPVGHVAYFETNASTPAKFEVTATTVGDMFQNVSLDGSTADTISKGAAQATTSANSTSTGTSTSSKPITIKTPSYVAAYNLWQTNLVKNGAADHPDVITVFWTDVPTLHYPNPVNLVDAKVITPDYVPLSRASAYDASILGKNTAAKANNRKIQTANPVSVGQLNKQVMTIDQGTSVIDVLNRAITNSSYVTKQLVDPTTQQGKTSDTPTDPGSSQSIAGNKPVNWFKISPVVFLKSYDKQRNTYAKDMIYCIQPYMYHNQKDPRAPMSQPKTIVRDYEYIYTGKNIDIIDFKIEYNYLWFNAMLVTPNKTEAVANSKNAKPNKQTQSQTPTSGGNPTPYRNVPVSQTQQAGNSSSTFDSQKMIASSVANNIYSDVMGGDMLSIEITIVGDPEWIKQDDIFHNPLGSAALLTNQYLNGSFQQDGGQTFVRIAFNTPVDFDDVTGLNRNNPDIPQLIVQGIYNVMTVTSNFDHGEFTQRLKIVKQPMESNPAASASANSTSQRLNDQMLTTPGPSTSIMFKGSSATQSTGVSVNSPTSLASSGLALPSPQSSTNPVVTQAVQNLNPLSTIAQTGPTIPINTQPAANVQNALTVLGPGSI